MAPAGTAAKPPKSASTKASGKKLIIPAIPLPYVKRQAAAQAAAAARVATESSTSALATVSTSPDIQEANGLEVKPRDVESSPFLEDIASRKEEKAKEPSSSETSVVENSHTDDSSLTFDSTNVLSDSPLSSGPALRRDDEKAVESPPPSKNQNPPVHHNPISTTGDSTQSVTHGPGLNERASMNFAVKDARVRPAAPTSPNRYPMPLPFHPPNGPPPGMVGNGDMAQVPHHPIPNGPPMHHSHPSNGSAVQFGLYGNSTNSSPAPPHSGGIAPPPGMPLNDGRAPYIGPPGNGYPPMMPLGADMIPVTHYDGFARPTVAYTPPEPFQPYANTFGPSTPHSLHGSQSSGHHDEPMPHNAYAPGHPRHERSGFSQDFQAYNTEGRTMMERTFPRNGAAALGRLPIQEDNPDGLSDYVKQQFGNPDLSDCIVELRYLDNRAAPVRVPGHRLILARSPSLAAVMRRQPLEQRALILETDNKWVRSDAFYMNLQRLYGLPLIPVMPYPDFGNGGSLAEAGSLDEKVDFALAYAASGKILGWEIGILRGCEVAARLLDWRNLEKILGFALESFIDQGTYQSYKYDVGSKILLEKIVHFILQNMPRSFALDATVPESGPYSRLPLDPGTSPTTSSDDPPPIIVRGSQNAGKGHRHQLSNIQFGDLSVMEGANGSAFDTPKASQQARPVSHATISRVLLSVPFCVLQMLADRAAEANIGEPHATAIAHAVIEREARRRRVIEAVMDGRVVDKHSVVQQLRAPEPRALDRWGVLGWQEEVSVNHDRQMPTLVRRWTPLRDGYEAPVAEFP